MQKLIAIYVILMFTGPRCFTQTGNVGIGTNTPKTLFHVEGNGTVLFGTDTTGPGTKMMWIPSKQAFRAGIVVSQPPYLSGNAWDYDSIGAYSFAAGLHNIASSAGSFAVGRENESIGIYAASMGFGNINKGYSSIAGGYYNIVEGDYSTVFGHRNTIQDNFNTVFGSHNAVSGYGSFVSGSQNYATSDESVILGSSCLNSGFRSIAIGFGNRITADYGFVGGSSNTMNAIQGFAFGESNRLNSFRGTVFGSYCDSIAGSMAGTWVSTDPLFILGNGTSHANRKNALIVLKNGNVGIGTNSPQALLQVTHNSHVGDPQLILEESGNDFSRVSFKNTNPGYWDIAGYTQPLLGNNSNAQFNFYYSMSDINVLSLRGNGNAVLAGTLTQSSDERLKKNLVRINNILPKLENLYGYTYQWKDTARGDEEQVGLLAQEIEKQFPQLVYSNEQGLKSVAYANMTPILLQAIKEQQLQIDRLNKLVESLLPVKNSVTVNK